MCIPKYHTNNSVPNYMYGGVRPPNSSEACTVYHGSLWPMKIVQTVCASFLRKMIDVSGDSIILRK